MPLKEAIKYLIHSMAATYTRIALKLSQKPQLIILTYHRILPIDHEQRLYEQPGMIATPEALQMHLRIMEQLSATPIDLAEWLNKQKNGQTLPKLAYAVTFDDGWQDNYQFAYPTLLKQNIPATIFLVSDYIDTNNVFWPEQLAYLLHYASHHKPALFEQPALKWLKEADIHFMGKPFNEEDIDLHINNCKQYSDEFLYKQLADSISQIDNTPTRHILSKDEIQEMQQQSNISYGSHTEKHYRLDKIDNEQNLYNEIVRSKEKLIALTEQTINIFCYPNGDISTEGQQLIKQHYQAACTTEKGFNELNSNPYHLKRFNLHDGNSGTPQLLLSTLCPLRP